MFCKECGIENNDNTLRCKSCYTYLKSSNSPLTGEDKVKVISFFILIFFPFFLLFGGVIITLIIIASIYIMKKNNKFTPMVNARKYIKDYLVFLVVALAALTAFLYYQNQRNDYYYHKADFEEHQQAKKHLKNKKEYVKNIVLNGSNNKIMGSEMPMPDRNGLFNANAGALITDAEIDAVSAYVANGMTGAGADVFAGTCFYCHGEKGEGVYYVAPSLNPMIFYNAQILEKKEEQKTNLPEYIIYTILVGILGLALSPLAVILLMWIFDILFFKPLEEHQEWILQHGIFADKPNEKSMIDTTKEILQSCKKSQSCSIADELLKWKSLLDQGVITEEEFNAKKEKLLK